VPPSHATAHFGVPPPPCPTEPPIPVVPPSPAMPCRALSSTAPKPGGQERGPLLAGPRPSTGAAGRCQAVPPSSVAGWLEMSVPRSALRRMEEG
jgi:hypothetical protein